MRCLPGWKFPPLKVFWCLVFAVQKKEPLSISQERPYISALFNFKHQTLQLFEP
jgi:hypothetical protein